MAEITSVGSSRDSLVRPALSSSKTRRHTGQTERHIVHVGKVWNISRCLYGTMRPIPRSYAREDPRAFNRSDFEAASN